MAIGSVGSGVTGADVGGLAALSSTSSAPPLRKRIKDALLGTVYLIARVNKKPNVVALAIVVLEWLQTLGFTVSALQSASQHTQEKGFEYDILTTLSKATTLLSFHKATMLFSDTVFFVLTAAALMLLFVYLFLLTVVVVRAAYVRFSFS